jgi:hypothetical protein
MYWPTLSDPAAEEARLRGVTAAARAVLAMHTHDGMLLLPHSSAVFMTGVLHKILDDNTASGGLLYKLRVTNALTREEEATLREQVLPAVTKVALAGEDAVMTVWKAHHRRAAEDMARHGLRACALPGCGATEPQPKTFKVCSRCRRACYCSAAHQQQDWRRHKREDACAAAPQ